MSSFARPRNPRADTALAAATAGTAWIAMAAWRGFAEHPGGFLNPLMLLAIVVAAVGSLARWRGLPAPLVIGSQALLGGMMASLLITGSPLPVGGAWAELHSELAHAIDTANAFAAPVPTTAPPLDPLLVLCGLVCLLLVDALACTLRRVSLAGLPLLTIYTIPLGLLGGGVGWWVFAMTAGGFLMMLFLQESEQVARWGRPIGDRATGDPIAFGAGAHATRSTATAIGGAATALAVFVPLVLPTASVHVFDFGPGQGGGGDISIDNPVADLVRDLRRGPDIPLVEVRTTDPDPSYLRILALTRFNDDQWSPGDRDVPDDHLADGQLPPPQGVAAEVSRQEFPYTVRTSPSFDSKWLPTEPPISRIQAPGDWRYDDKTMDFLAGDSNLTASGIDYTMTAVHLDLTPERLADAAAPTGLIREVFTQLPDNVPAIARDLALQVTRGQTTQYDQAVALQNWFRVGGGFTYTLDTAPGNGPDALQAFLEESPTGREGYCEQFASAMAVMARILGIPARVAIGFLNPDEVGRHDYVYSSHDLHAWPELYFDGAGWVRFEPTPAARATNVPAYTIPGGPGGGIDSEPTRAPSTAATQVPNNRPTESTTPEANDPTRGAAGSGFPWLPVICGGSVVLVALLACLLPLLVRRGRRRRRLAAGPEEIWAELRDTATDLQLPWPPGRSPRATQQVLVNHLGAPRDAVTPERPASGASVNPAAVDALDRLVQALERLRYARAGTVVGDPQSLRADGHTVVAALEDGATRAGRRRARWWPRSVISWPRRRRLTGTAVVETRYGGVVDHVG